MGKGLNQTVVRDVNVKMIIEALRKRDLSRSDLADKLNLSKPALTKITGEMLTCDLIRAVSSARAADNDLGRKRVYFAVNPDYGVVAGIDFSTVDIKIGIFDMQGKQLEEGSIEDSEYITQEVLDKITEKLRTMISAIGKNELLAICLGVSGKVNSKQGNIYMSPKFKACKDIDVKAYFENKFAASVSIKNDINLAFIGEKDNGCLRSGLIKNAIMIYIDSGIGGSIYIDGKLFEGSNGYAGEFGLMMTPDKKGGEIEYDILYSINGMKRTIKDIRNLQHYRFKDLLADYKAGDKTVKEVVSDAAYNIGKMARDAVDAFDVNHIFISGRVNQLGDEYLNGIAKVVNSRYKEVSVKYCGVDGGSILKGAKHIALEMAVDAAIRKR